MTKKTVKNILEGSFLYRNCMQDWWPALDAQCRVEQYKKGAVIFREGEPVKGMFFVIDGLIKVHKRWGEEKELILRFAGNDAILGHRGLATHNANYPVTATAIANSSVCFLDMDFFRKTMMINAGFLYRFMLFFADELQLSEQRMKEMAYLPVRKRVARALLRLSETVGRQDEGNRVVNINRQDLAAYVGTAYETLYLVLMEFAQSGWIETAGKVIRIKAVDALKESGL